MTVTTFLLACCAMVYVVLSMLIAWGSRRTPSLLLTACCVMTAGWAVIALAQQGTVIGIVSGADLLRALSVFSFIFYLYHDAQFGRPSHELGFALAGVVAACLGAAAFVVDAGFGTPGAMVSLILMARLLVAVTELLLIENLYFNLPDHARWHVALPSVLLGGLACFDLLLCADLVLFRHPNPVLEDARTLAMIGIAPLLVVAGGRTQRWTGRMKLSRSAVFHSATLVLSGSALLALGLAGEVFRQFGADWGWFAEVSLAFAAMMAVALLMTSGSARSRFQRLVVDHFFAERFDYRRQWQACIRTLSGDDGELHSPLATRVIRTVVSVVDSPAGVLLLRDGGTGPFNWAGSWNMPATEAVPAGHPIVAAVQNGSVLDDTWILRLDGPDRHLLVAAPLDGLGPLWLAVPLVHRGALIGLVLSAGPRAPFELVQEVFDLLRIVAQEVATYIAEQRATQILLQARHLHDYGKRFAFVAHDIKNVSSQLAMLLSNAEDHIGNPEFQQDMLVTVGASVRKITLLLQRLEQPETDSVPTALLPIPRLEALIATYQRVRKARLLLEHDGSTGNIGLGVDAFETVITHLLNNAVQAAAGSVVVVRVRHEARQVVIDIVDQGPGMTAAFVRDELFRPFSTTKADGSGIGAYQSRELLQAAGGELVVISQPGRGTTMRLLLPRTDMRLQRGPAMSAGALSDADV